MILPRRINLALAMAVSSAGCARSTAELGLLSPTCEQITEEESLSIDPFGLAGTFTVTLVAADSVDQAAASGSMSLWVQDTAYQFVRDETGRKRSPDVAWPLAGTFDSDLSSIGISRTFVPMDSRDPTRPGVLMTRQKDGSLVLVVGTARAFDGAGILMFILEATDSGFRGNWVQGDAPIGDSNSASRFFCAVRQGA